MAEAQIEKSNPKKSYVKPAIHTVVDLSELQEKWIEEMETCQNKAKSAAVGKKQN